MQVVYKLYDVEYRKYRAGQLKRGEMSRKYHDIFDRRVEIFLCSNKLSIGIPDFSAKRSRTINNGAAECELDATITIVLFVKGINAFFSQNALLISVIFVIPW